MILLDTQTLIWLTFNDDKLGAKARQVIDEAWRADEAAVSAISFWEIGMLHEKRRIALLPDVETLRLNLLEDGLVEVPVDGAIGLRAAELRDLQRDPADRIIVATALEGYRLVTADRGILEWPGAVDRLDART